MGQFATPPGLAAGILRRTPALICKKKGIMFMDPAVGTGSFYSALLETFPKHGISRAVGYEIDTHCGALADDLWGDAGLEVRVGDFTRAEPPAEDGDRFDLIICNPPYVRHHHIPSDKKRHLAARTLGSCGADIGGRAGLYCYFIGMSHAWMRHGAVAGWLIPSEFMDVVYGAPLRRYLTDTVTLLHIHRFDPNHCQFNDTRVSSAIVWFSKQKPMPGHAARFTYGRSLESPSQDGMIPLDVLRTSPKWTRYPAMKPHATRHYKGGVLGDFFRIKRGLATGGNGYFIMPEDEVERRGLPREGFRPVLPGPRHLAGGVVQADGSGNPVLERRLLLLDCRLPEDELARRHPLLHEYIEKGRKDGVAAGYLCRNRLPWYSQENRPPAPILCTYMGKNKARPFRFILNESQATATNAYLMLYPVGKMAAAMADPEIRESVWRLLNGIRPQTMIGEGRVYGGGLHKVEPGELCNVPAGGISGLLSG